MLTEYIWESDDWGAPKLCDSHDLLIAAVRKFVLPNLVQNVEVFEIGGIHNPIRAKSVDGELFDNHYDPHQPDLIEPSILEVAVDDVRQLAHSLSAPKEPNNE